MRGFRIIPKWKEIKESDGQRSAIMDIPVPPTESTFSLFFAPILPNLSKFHWVFPESPFAPRPDDIEFFHRFYDDDKILYLSPDTWLPKHARHIKEDWADLFGFLVKPDLESFLTQAECNNYDYIEAHTEICFYNVDGVWWEFYARDEQLLSLVEKHARSLTNVEVELWSLKERDRNRCGSHNESSG